jgi:hypothetical protein
MIYDGKLFTVLLREVTTTITGGLAKAGAVRSRSQSGMATARIIDGERILDIADIRDNEAYLGGDPIQRGPVERGGFRTLVSVAPRQGTTLLG